MAFYTFVKQVGDKILHRFVDGSGHRKTEAVRGFPINLYVKTTESKATTRSLYGDPLAAVNFSDVSDASNFVREYRDTQDIFGQTNLAYQFISHKYPNQIAFDFNKIKTLIIDIETAYDSKPVMKYNDDHTVKVRNKS